MHSPIHTDVHTMNETVDQQIDQLKYIYTASCTASKFFELKAAAAAAAATTTNRSTFPKVEHSVFVTATDIRGGLVA